jgi:hypothetical protein
MRGGTVNRGGLFLLAAALSAALLFATGCGSSGSDEVTVQAGSLSKAEFIRKADEICKAARTEFLAKFTGLVKAHQSVANGDDVQKKEELIAELVDTILTPNIEGQVVKISKLGAPSGYAPEATTFLNALQERLDKAKEDPAGISATSFPFKKAEDTARRVGMYGCAESFG